MYAVPATPGNVRRALRREAQLSRLEDGETLDNDEDDYDEVQLDREQCGCRCFGGR